MKSRITLHISVFLMVFSFALPAQASHCTKENRNTTYGCPAAPGQIVCGDAPNFSCYSGQPVNETALNTKNQEFSCSSCTAQCKSTFYNCDGNANNGCEQQGSLAGTACTSNGLQGTYSDACGTNCSVTVEYVQRQQIFPGNPESGHVNVLGNIKGGGYLNIVRSGDDATALETTTLNIPEGALYYKSGTGLRVKGANDIWQDVGKSYTAGTNIDSGVLTSSNIIKVRPDPTFSVVNIGGGALPTSFGTLRVGSSVYLNGGQALMVEGTGTPTLHIKHPASGQNILLNIVGGLKVDASTFFVDAANNRVGIGTSTPDKLLTVAGYGVITNLDVGNNLQVVNSGAFGNYNPDPTWRVSSPNLYVGTPGQGGAIIGAGGGQAAGDIKADRLIVVGGKTSIIANNQSCPAGQTLIDFDEDGTADTGELCYITPSSTPETYDLGFAVFGGKVHVSKLLSAVGGLTVAGQTTIFDPNNFLLANGNIVAKQINLNKSLTISPTPDDTVAEQYALRVLDTSGNEWFSVRRTGSVGDAAISSDRIHVRTMGDLTAAKLGTSSRFDTPELVVNSANTFGLPAGTKFFVNGDSKLQGKLTVVGEFKIDSLKTPKIQFDSIASNQFHIDTSDSNIRIKPEVKLFGRLVLSGAVEDENNNEIISADSKVHLSRLAAEDFDTPNEGSLVLMAKNGTSCTAVCNNHKLSCDSNVGVIRFDTTFGGTNVWAEVGCSDLIKKRLCPCGPPQVQ